MLDMKKGILTILFAVLLLPPALRAADFDEEMRLAWRARQEKKFDEAQGAYDRALRERPESEAAQVGLLYTYLEKGDTETAGKMAAGLVKKFPENLWIRKARAYCLYMNGDYRGSEKAYRELLSGSGEDCEMRLGLGLSLLRQGRADEGKKECGKCPGAAGDARFRDCIKGKAAEVPAARPVSEWRFSPFLSATYLSYANPWDRKYLSGISAGVDAFHSSGIGFYLDAGYLSSRYSYSPAVSVAGLKATLSNNLFQVFRPGPGPVDLNRILGFAGDYLVLSRLSYNSQVYRELDPGLGLYYTQPKYFLWLHYLFMKTGLGGSPGSAHVVSLYGNRLFGNLRAGSGLDVGIFNGYRTCQLTPEIGYRLPGRFRVSLVPMVQFGSGSVPGSFTSAKTARLSASLVVNSYFSWVNLDFALGAGNRWHTVEDGGLTVWSGDEEYSWGMKTKAVFFPGNSLSPFISLRFDRGIKLYGLSHSFSSFGGTLGIKYNF